MSVNINKYASYLFYVEKFIHDVTDHKDLCWLFIDDRCINFQGDYKILNNQIQNFKAWYKN